MENCSKIAVKLKKSTAPLPNAALPKVHTTEPWDGKDGELPEEEEWDLSDVELDDLEEVQKDEL